MADVRWATDVAHHDRAGGAAGRRRLIAQLVERYRHARRDAGLAVLEGFHPLKHALRFGAEILDVAAVDDGRAGELARALAPDIEPALAALRVETVDPEVFDRLSPVPPRERIIALARRPVVDSAAVLASTDPSPIILLENPRHLGNVGAAVRVGAAAGAAALFTTGTLDPWHPQALRGAAGLHYALPVARLDGLPATDRPVVALDPAGEPLAPGLLPARAVLAFGTERWGLSDELRARAVLRIAIPMRAGVSSLSLATAVAVALYAARTSW